CPLNVGLSIDGARKMTMQVRAFWQLEEKSPHPCRRVADRIKVTGRTFCRPSRLSRNCDREKKNQGQYRGDFPDARVSVNCFAQVFAPGLRIARSRHSKRRWSARLSF